MRALAKYFKPVVKNEEGQTLIEYALIIVLIILIAVAAFPPLGAAVAKAFADVTALF